jgi:HAD superfamily hydrolase (TIGR01509 family)
MIKALIFDFDGLMVDTETARFQAWSEVFRRCGSDITVDEWRALASEGFDFEPCDELERRLGHGIDRTEVTELRRRISKPITDTKPLLPGVDDYIQSARRIGLGLAVASNSPRGWVSGHLERLGVDSGFDAVLCGDDVERGKPAPDIYLAAMSVLGVAAHEALAFEDSPVGLKSARAAGLTCVAVPNELTKCLDLSDAHLVMETLSEMSLEEVLEKLDLGSR